MKLNRLLNAKDGVWTLIVTGLLLIIPAKAIELLDFEATARGFPPLLDLKGTKLADGEFIQWLENDRLHVKIIYQFSDGRRVEEDGVFRQKPALVQDEWLWEESRTGQIYRKFAVDFSSGKGSAEKREKNEIKHWSENLKIQPGQTFAGFGFALALKGLRPRLVKGEKVELQAVAFTPKPRTVSVEISYQGLDELTMAGRRLKGDRFLIHPKIPKIAKLFVEAPDTRIWLFSPPPAAFLRWEGPLAEPDDQIVRVDLLPGGQSGPAVPSPSR